MNIESLINELEDLLETSWGLPLTGGRTIVNSKEVMCILDDLRNHIPEEVKQAKAVVADRAKILDDARSEAERIIKSAENKAMLLVSENEIVKKSEAKAKDIMEKLQLKSKEMKLATSEYVDDLIRKTDEVLSANLSELRKTRKSLKGSPNLSSDFKEE